MRPFATRPIVLLVLVVVFRGIHANAELHWPITPTRVTLKLEAAQARAAFAELSKQATDVTIEIADGAFPPGREPRVTIALDNVMFWEAFHQLCEKTHLAPQYPSFGRRIVLVADDSGWAQRPRKTGEFYTVMLRGLEKPTDPQRPPSLVFDIWFDPKAKVFVQRQGIAITELVDDAGNSLATADLVDRSKRTYSGGGMGLKCSIYVQIPPATVDRAGSRIARLRGEAPIEMLERSRNWIFRDILNVKDQAIVSPLGKHEFGRIQENSKGVYQFWLGFTPSTANFADPHPFWNSALIQLVDEKGQRYLGGGGAQSGSMYRMSMGYHPPPGVELGPPDYFTWLIPEGIKKVIVPIEFDDLPIASK